MDDLSLVLLTAASTGLFTAIINQVFGGWFAERRQRDEQTHQKAMQEDHRRHERLLRQEEAHAKAMDVFVDDAASTVEWLRYEWGSQYGLDAEWVPEHDPKPGLNSVTDVIGALTRIELRHPTKSVRDSAHQLRQQISGQYGSIEPVWNSKTKDHTFQTGVAPSSNKFDEWLKMGESLVDTIHAPTIEDS